MKTLAIICCLLAASVLPSWSGGNGEVVHYDNVAQITGPIPSIDRSSLTNKTEAMLHEIRIPEVVFAQAGFTDIAHFLDRFVQQHDTIYSNHPIHFESTGESTDHGAKTATFAGRDISVLQLLRYMQNCGIEISITDQLVTIGKK